MQHWRKFGVLIPLLALLCFGGNVRAQENERTTIYVRYFINAISDNVIEVSRDFMDELEERLATFDINIVFFGNFSQSDTPVDNLPIFLNFSDEFDDERIIVGTRVSISAHSEQVNAISPMLQSRVYASFLFPSDDAYTLATTLLLYAANRCDLALPLADRWAEISDETPQMEDRFRANCALVEGELEQAAELYEGFIFSETGNFYGTNLVWVYFQLGREDEAFDLLNEALEENENFADLTAQILIPRAQLYALAFRNDEALADFNTAIELAPNYAIAYFHRGVFFYSRAQYADAQTDFTRYLELAPHGDRVDDAINYIDEMEQIDPPEGA